ncbi:hypothetical protein D5S18_00590 [Nocardia panacis]|uniref:Secreted protein n=1 Tax=Nocardia panacis TaxID=2340916 RepID=A0A3A4L957_9NOCA|nr:hypothetical protein [Nocardia panacis]RJO79812.1 hypothetical protein D5S18_00590 [Nocardia panacis]
MRSFHRAVAVSVLAVPALACASCAAQHPRADTPRSGATSVLNCVARARVRPADIPITCADPNHFITGITWDIWEDEAARGTGTDDRNLCVPNCAADKRQAEAVTLELTNPVHGVFTLLTITDSSGKQGNYALPG